MDSLVRLSESIEKAKIEGWKTITDSHIELKQQFIQITELRAPSTRIQIAATNIFLQLFNPSLREHIITSKNSSFKKPKRGVRDSPNSGDIP